MKLAIGTTTLLAVGSLLGTTFARTVRSLNDNKDAIDEVTLFWAKRKLASMSYSIHHTLKRTSVLVECGESLPPGLTPDFPMGACGTRMVNDSRVWGPQAWQMLHVMAQNYPLNPSAQAIQACMNFVNALPYMLPDPYSGYQMSQFLISNIKNAGTYDISCQASQQYGMPCTNPSQAFLLTSSS